MKYVNAHTVLPAEIVELVQRHFPGGLIYIPKPKEMHRKWGEDSGARALVRRRNEEIRAQFADGASMADLAAQFFLSDDSIRKIVYGKKET